MADATNKRRVVDCRGVVYEVAVTYREEANRATGDPWMRRWEIRCPTAPLPTPRLSISSALCDVTEDDGGGERAGPYGARRTWHWRFCCA
jgi:hypothetical protein